LEFRGRRSRVGHLLLAPLGISPAFLVVHVILGHVVVSRAQHRLELQPAVLV
jgi:hypothetical protein